MRKLLLIGTLLSALTLVGCTSTPADETDEDVTLSQTYTNTGGFSLRYPNNRTYQENIYGSRVLFFSPQATGDKLRENIGVVMQTLPAEMSVEDYYKLVVKPQAEKIITDYKEISQEDVNINGWLGKKIIYQGTQSNYTLKWQQVLVIKEKMVYLLTYTAADDTFKQYSKVADELMNSFTISE